MERVHEVFDCESEANRERRPLNHFSSVHSENMGAKKASGIFRCNQLNQSSCVTGSRRPRYIAEVEPEALYLESPFTRLALCEADRGDLRISKRYGRQRS